MRGLEGKRVLITGGVQGISVQHPFLEITVEQRQRVINIDLKGVFYVAQEADRPLNRIGSPEDVAQAVLYLSGDASSFVTGTTLDVDGGGLAGG